MIEAVIFDMDGLLIDSEPLWQQAEIAIFKQVEIILIPSMCLQTKGLRIDEVVEYWYKKYPWDKLSKLQVQEAIVDKLIEFIHTEGKALAGVEDAINFVKAKNLKIALASSSSYKIINAALEKLNIADAFEIIYSAESETLGKTSSRRLSYHCRETGRISSKLLGFGRFPQWSISRKSSPNEMYRYSRNVRKS